MCTIGSIIEVSNIILSRSERRVQPLFAPSRTQCKTFGAHLSLKTRLNRFFCRLRPPDRINLSSHPCKSRAGVSSYAWASGVEGLRYSRGPPQILALFRGPQQTVNYIAQYYTVVDIIIRLHHYTIVDIIAKKNTGNGRWGFYYRPRDVTCLKNRSCLRKIWTNLNASKPSEHPPQVEECLKA